MSRRIHDEEADTSEPIVRSLLEAQCPHWVGASLSYLETSGSDNAMWRLRSAAGERAVVRLPRTDGAATSVSNELEVLPHLRSAGLTDSVSVPMILHPGRATSAFPHPWAVLDWLPGEDGWSARRRVDGTSAQLGLAVADMVLSVRSVSGAPVTPRPDRARGGSLDLVLDGLEAWLSNPAWHVHDLLDVSAIRRSAAESAEAATSAPIERTFVHGDLIPGNLLFQDGTLAAAIDWGGAAFADPAQDLSPAWAVLEDRGRAAFRERCSESDEMWLRGRGFELEHAVGGILYYRPRGHPLADVMERTLHRILGEGPPSLVLAGA